MLLSIKGIKSNDIEDSVNVVDHMHSLLHRILKNKNRLVKINLVELDLGQWCQIDEAIHVAATDEEYKKYAGINNNEKLIERLAELKLYNSEIFINAFSNPRTLVLGSIEGIAYSKTKKLELELNS